jgi:hypothetical protein
MTEAMVAEAPKKEAHTPCQAAARAGGVVWTTRVVYSVPTIQMGP